MNDIPALPKNIPKNVIRLIGKAMHQYRMIEDQDRILVAVSGGIDSLFLAWILHAWRRKAPISYEITAVHLDMGFGAGKEKNAVERELQKIGIPFLVEYLDYGKEAVQGGQEKNLCFHCAKRRRNRLFECAREQGAGKIALGHHKEDIIETFFLNLLYAGNMSTMLPRQDLFEGRLTLIRPLAFLEKKDISLASTGLGIMPVPNPCPLSDRTKRMEIRRDLERIYTRDNRIKSNIFRALGNCKPEYLLKHGTSEADTPFSP